MSGPIPAIALLGSGVLLGVGYFGGLWWTVRMGMAANNPAVYFLLSLLLRMGSVLTAFYFVSATGWQGVLLCLCGFVIARIAVTRFTRSATGKPHAA